VGDRGAAQSFLHVIDVSAQHQPLKDYH
jgi:hypothetical protein